MKLPQAPQHEAQVVAGFVIIRLHPDGLFQRPLRFGVPAQSAIGRAQKEGPFEILRLPSGIILYQWERVGRLRQHEQRFNERDAGHIVRGIEP